MIKKLLAILFLLFLTGSLFAQYDLFAGIGAELNGQTRRGAAIGGGLLLGFEFMDDFAAGLKTAYFNNLYTVSCVETEAFFRYYLPWVPFSLNVENRLFAQAEAGVIVFFEYGNVFPAFSGGLAFGWRFNFGEKWFLEPALRIGYPHIWGLSVTGGLRFPIQSKNERYYE